MEPRKGRPTTKQVKVIIMIRAKRSPVAMGLLLGVWVTFGMNAGAQDAKKKEPVKMTIKVLDPATAKGMRLPKASEFQEGRPIVPLARRAKDSTVQVLVNSLIVLRADRRVTYKIDRTDVLAAPAEKISFPRGVQGIFQARKAGTVVLTVVDADVPPECPPGINCDGAWSGYILKEPSTSYTSVSGQWTVPTLASTSPQGNSSSWVGIGGDSGMNTLIQAGTAQDFGSFLKPYQGTAYFAWYQIVPAKQVIIPNKPVSPGDVIQVTIAPSLGQPIPVAGKDAMWVISMKDVTKNWSYSATETYGGDLGTAEWILESPTYPDTPTRLPDYQQIEFNFGNQVAKGGGALGRPNFCAKEEIWMNQGGANGTFSTPSNPSGDKEGFYVTWTSGAANQVFPPGPWIQTTSLPPALIRQPYSQTLMVNQAASPTWTFSGFLPDGVRFNQLLGVVSGTPTAPGDFKFSVFATDTTNGSYSATQSLILSVLETPKSSLQINCIEFGPTPPPAINVTVDSTAEPCNAPIILPTGLHTVTGTPLGSGPFKVTYAGACNASGQVSLTLGNSATCAVSAQTLSSFENACPAQQHCCEPSATGCLKCIPAKMSCP